MERPASLHSFLASIASGTALSKLFPDIILLPMSKTESLSPCSHLLSSRSRLMSAMFNSIVAAHAGAMDRKMIHPSSHPNRTHTIADGTAISIGAAQRIS